MFTNSTPEIYKATRLQYELMARQHELLREAKDACRPAAVTQPNRWKRAVTHPMPSLGRIFAHGRA